MKFLALERETPGFPSDQWQPHLRPEAAHAWELYQSGLIRELYFDSEHHTAVLILECADKEAAINLLATLPLVVAGAITFEVIPLVPYPGFARLFSKD
jgi:muconolactone delta-isomerase